MVKLDWHSPIKQLFFRVQSKIAGACESNGQQSVVEKLWYIIEIEQGNKKRSFRSRRQGFITTLRDTDDLVKIPDQRWGLEITKEGWIKILLNTYSFQRYPGLKPQSKKTGTFRCPHVVIPTCKTGKWREKSISIPSASPIAQKCCGGLVREVTSDCRDI